MNEPTSSPPPQRSTLFYVGSAIAAIGFLLFLSTFFSAALNFGNFDHFEERGRSMALRAVTGFTLILVGQVVVSLGAARRFGPQITKAFQDRAQQFASSLIANPPQSQLVHCRYCNTDCDPTAKNCPNCGAALEHDKRCTGCGQINEPGARFCNHCGHALV